MATKLKTQAQLIAKFGNPATNTPLFEKNWMVIWDIPDDINKSIPALPNRVYVNKILVAHLENTFRELISANVHHEIKTWDGCFNVRKKRGLSTLSTHAFGIAVDLNAAWNPLGGKISWTDKFLSVWRNTGWVCGADWSGRKDGMHFQGDNFF